MSQIKTAALVVAGFTLPLLILHPLQNVPYVDDWTYAWSVENVLNTGSVKILDWSNNIDLAHILWGALFCLPGGFSFEALRLSTWVLSMFGLIGFYLLLLELGVSRRDSLIGVLMLGFSPMYFLLSFTFMTDVPAITFTTWSLLCFMKGLNTGRNHWSFSAAAFSILTIGTRVPGLSIPLAVGAFLLFRKNAGTRRIFAALVGTVVPLACAATLVYWYMHHIEYRSDLTWVRGSQQERLANLRYGFIYLPQWMLTTVFYAVPALGMLLAPLAISCAKREHYRKILAAVAVMIVLCAVGFLTGVASPSNHGANRFLVDLGGSYLDVPGAARPAGSPVWNMLAGAVGMLLFCIALGPTLSRKSSSGEVILRWLFLMQCGFIVVLALWFARYLLPLLPILLALVLAATPIRRPWRASALIAFSAIISIAVLHDELAYNRALWLSADYLRQTGAPLPRVNGGYMVNGWLQYAHRENAKINKNGEVEVNIINVVTKDFDYQISNRAEAGWLELKTFPYYSWLETSGDLHILKRKPH